MKSSGWEISPAPLFFISNRISNLGLKNQGKTGGVVRFKREIVQEKNGGLNVPDEALFGSEKLVLAHMSNPACGGPFISS